MLIYFMKTEQVVPDQVTVLIVKQQENCIKKRRVPIMVYMALITEQAADFILMDTLNKMSGFIRYQISLHYRFVCQEAFRWGLSYPFHDLDALQKDFLSRLPSEELEYHDIRPVTEEMEKIQKAFYTASFLWQDCIDLMQQYFDALKEMYCQYEQITMNIVTRLNAAINKRPVIEQASCFILFSQ